MAPASNLPRIFSSPEPGHRHKADADERQEQDLNLRFEDLSFRSFLWGRRVQQSVSHRCTYRKMSTPAEYTIVHWESTSIALAKFLAPDFTK